MKRSFGSKELCRCLKHLGFRLQSSRGTSHVKFKIPPGRKIPVGTRPFIIVQMGRKSYDKHSSTRYLRQIKDLGFSEEEVKLTC